MPTESSIVCFEQRHAKTQNALFQNRFRLKQALINQAFPFPPPFHFKCTPTYWSLLQTRNANSYLLFIQYSGAASSRKYRVREDIVTTPKIEGRKKDKRHKCLFSHLVVLNNTQKSTSAVPTSYILTISSGHPVLPWKGRESRKIERG